MTIGDSIGPYVILDLLGAGGMGEVYRARDTRLGREVALKRLSDSSLADGVARRRVMREARSAATLSHPGIATIFDVLDVPDGPVIVMEYVPGESLATRLARGPLPTEQAIDFALQIADALAEAHRHEVVHRDLKPANIHITPANKAKILDFGIARSTSEEAGRAAGHLQTDAWTIIGSPGYMAPEQLAGGATDQRTDIYGLGVVLFEMVTGRRPILESDIVGTAMAIFEGRVPKASEVAPHVPAALSDLITRAMARKPEDRFQTAGQFGETLRSVARRVGDAPTVGSNDPAAVPVVPHASPRTVTIRRRTAWMLGLIVVAAATFVIWRFGQPWSSNVSARAALVGVLPFSNLTGDPADDPLAVGLTEALARRLAPLRAVRVLPLEETRLAAQSSADASHVARSIGAAYVVEGAVHRSGQSLQVDVSLVGYDGKRRSAGTYQGDPGRLFDLHRRVAEGISTALGDAGLLQAGAAPAAAPPTANQEAFADYSQARLFLERPDVAGNLDRAVRLFQSAIDKDSRFALAWAGLGEAYWAQYRETKDAEWTVKATAAILDALRIDPDQPEVRMSLAVMYDGLGRWNEAAEELRRVMALQPQNDDAHRLLAGILLDRGQLDEAVTELQQAIDLRPNYWRNHSELGRVHLRAGRLDDAEEAYRRVTELQPDNAVGFHMLGTVQQSAGQLDEAFANYQEANKIRPRASTHSNLGTLYYWRGDYARAASAYTEALRLDSGTPDVHANLGDAYQKLGKPDLASENYRQAIALVRKQLDVNERDPLNLAALAIYHAKLAEREAAERAIVKALDVSPNDAEVLYARAIVHALTGDTNAACAALGEALARGTSAVLVRHADELKGLNGCAAYDRAITR